MHERDKKAMDSVGSAIMTVLSPVGGSKIQ